jgi:hypothetical protein
MMVDPVLHLELKFQSLSLVYLQHVFKAQAKATYTSLQVMGVYCQLQQNKSWPIIGPFYVPLEFQLKMKNWIYHHSTGFLNYTSVLSNSAL